MLGHFHDRFEIQIMAGLVILMNFANIVSFQGMIETW